MFYRLLFRETRKRMTKYAPNNIVRFQRSQADGQTLKETFNRMMSTVKFKNDGLSLTSCSSGPGHYRAARPAKHLFARPTRGTKALILAFVFGALIAADQPEISVAPDAALEKLNTGNQRFTSSKVSASKPTAARRAETSKTQRPFAVIVGCADSRTSPEIVFDQNIGDLFVIRTAGNLVDDYALGSIEYAVEHLGARLVVVLGRKASPLLAISMPWFVTFNLLSKPLWTGQATHSPTLSTKTPCKWLKRFARALSWVTSPPRFA